jgi:hypothetical protein
MNETGRFQQDIQHLNVDRQTVQNKSTGSHVVSLRIKKYLEYTLSMYSI